MASSNSRVYIVVVYDSDQQRHDILIREAENRIQAVADSTHDDSPYCSGFAMTPREWQSVYEKALVQNYALISPKQ